MRPAIAVLQSFRNRMEHALLDRKLGIQFIEHVLHGGYPAYPAERAARSLDLLASDLERQFGAEFTFTRDAQRAESKAGTLTVPILARRNSTAPKLGLRSVRRWLRVCPSIQNFGRSVRMGRRNSFVLTISSRGDICPRQACAYMEALR